MGSGPKLIETPSGHDMAIVSVGFAQGPFDPFQQQFSFEWRDASSRFEKSRRRKESPAHGDPEVAKRINLRPLEEAFTGTTHRSALRRIGYLRVLFGIGEGDDQESDGR